MTNFFSFYFFLISILISNSSNLIPGFDYEKIHINRYGKNIEIDIFKLNPDSIDVDIISVSDKKTLKEVLANSEQENQYFLICNAGMFNTDYKTNMGYMKSDGSILNNREHPNYYSVLAFDPLSIDLPSFYIYDTDIVPLDSILKSYNSVVENLRLIKRSRENRWPEQEKRWTELAIGQDSDNNIIIIYCHNDLSMFEFNNLILSLPIDLSTAQHLEGNSPAQLYFSFKSHTIDLDNGVFVPNLLGFKMRKF